MTPAATAAAHDTYWDPHLSRTNLAEPVFDDLGRRTGLDALCGAGRVVVTRGDDPAVQRYLLVGTRDPAGRRCLELGHADTGGQGYAVDVGGAVNVSWFHAGAWFGASVHVLQAPAGGLVLDYPVTAYRFAVRDQLWASIDRLQRLFRGFDVTLSDLDGLTAVNHEERVLRYLNDALEDARPALLYLTAVDAIFSGRLLPPEGQRAPLQRGSAEIDLGVAGADLVGVDWRPGLEAVVSTMVRGDTLGFRTRVLQGRDARLRLAWPRALYRRQRRQLPRYPTGARGLVDFELNLPGGATARPVRVLDVGLGGAALVVERDTARRIGRRPASAEARLYGRLSFPIAIDVVDVLALGPRHYRYCCAFRDLDGRRLKALEVLCAKLSK